MGEEQEDKKERTNERTNDRTNNERATTSFAIMPLGGWSVCAFTFPFPSSLESLSLPKQPMIVVPLHYPRSGSLHPNPQAKYRMTTVWFPLCSMGLKYIFFSMTGPDFLTSMRLRAIVG